MPCNLFPHAYERLIDEDIEWLKANAPDSLERDHILAVLDFSKREYRARGYDEAMHKTGPHWTPVAATPPPPDAAHGPMTEAPEAGSVFWMLSESEPEAVIWRGHAADLAALGDGACFRTEADARAALQAEKGGA